MAFVAEVRARLGLDTTPFSRGLTKAQADVGKAATDMGGKLRRAFGAGDVFRGLLQGIGIGSVQGIVDTITSTFRKGADDAERMANESRSMLDIMRQQQLATAGQAQRFDILKKQVSELNQDIEVQKRLVADLEANPLNLITPGGREEVTKAKDELSRLRVEAAKADAQLRTEISLTNRRTDEWARASLEREDMRKLELSLLNEENDTIREISTSTLRLNQVQRELTRLRKNGEISTAETNRLVEEQSVLTDRLTELARIRAKEEKKARDEAVQAAAALGQGMATRAPALRPRGRTESERIADRAAMNEAQAVDALAKGDAVRAANRSRAAAADYIKAGSMQARAASGISPELANQLGGQLKEAVETLNKINENLIPAKIR
jgi:myosin heavy subunit